MPSAVSGTSTLPNRTETASKDRTPPTTATPSATTTASATSVRDRTRSALRGAAERT